MNKVKVLFFAADPLSADGQERRLLLDHEVRDIKAAIKAALHRDRIEFLTCEATRIDDLRREMLSVKPQIVHFSGHGGSEGLVLEGEDGRPHRVGGNALQRFFSALPYRPRVVVLNSCHSKQEADAIAKVIECAIGYPRRILDDHARAFSRAFYSSIAFGQSVGAAFEQARTTLEMKSCPDDELPELVPREAFDASGLSLV